MTSARTRRLGVACVAAMVVAGCQTTVDSLGYDDLSRITLHPLHGPASYPNAFRDLLSKGDPDISNKVNGAFNQLFHGDPNLQAIYTPIGTDQASINDLLHMDIRTEGIGYGMLICVEMDKRDEFDRLWTYAKMVKQVPAGMPAAGYYQSDCDVANGTSPCLDPFGVEQFVMALLLANDRWGSTTGRVDYATDVKVLLTVMRHKEDQNGGVVGGVTNMFDEASKLPFDLPQVSSANQSRPSIAIPPYYDLWAQATGDPFWSAAATSARAYWKRAASTSTGLSPIKALFDGEGVAGSDQFASESFRAQLSMVVDTVWSGASQWNQSTADLLINFFNGQGIATYGSSFTLDGATVLDQTRDQALVAVNGATGMIATAPERIAFITAVWNMDTPTGNARYYSGLLDLLSLLVLSGQLQVY